ncbi:MAG TPA: Smr/MutS family protein, partial [Pyrinomonadaceae bacterium]|nr:Smr/MutS family protein [Pyrinomonadaceae bacterium]
ILARVEITEMNDQAFGSLEYEGIRALLEAGAQTPVGRARCAEVAPLADLTTVRHSLAAVTEAVRLRAKGNNWSFSELSEPGELLGRARSAGTLLDPVALLEVARLCLQADAARGVLHAAREQCPLLWEIVAALPHQELQNLAARITRKITPGGEIDDRASPELAAIRARIVRLRGQITNSLERLMRRSEEAIQDQLVTLRNDRFVIPVRSDHRGRVQGVAHGFSSSGATTFIEPLETIEANNELQDLREQEEREVAQILLSLTEELRDSLFAVEAAAEVVATLDLIGAKTALAFRFDCVEPIVGPDESLSLVAARHPLLEENLRRATGGEVVPVSFTLTTERPVMVISGANAGGKTVVLKTAGLLALMALSGLHVPAREAHVPFYRSVLADIGDRQSLAANLSTFTAHLSNIRGMIESCRAPALVLLDEVGTGTDPEEGAALGVAVVDHFRRHCGAQVIATTHYSGLKMYAANDAGVLNASVEFDEKTLQPTYRLLVGVAGSSSGLEIARRFGLPAEVIDAATGRVSHATLDAANYLQRIKREADEAEALRAALEEERLAVAEKYAALDAEARTREGARQKEYERTLHQLIDDFDRRARELYTKIEDRAVRAKVEREAQTRAAELRREAERSARARSAAASPSPSRADVRVVRHSGEAETNLAPAAPSREVRVGDKVRLGALETVGVVERINDGEAEVRVGSLRFREKIANVQLLEGAAPPKGESGRGARLQRAASKGTEIHLRDANGEADAELNLIGRRTDEAVDATDKFLDEAFLHGFHLVRIIHGHGTGALRRAIQDFLRHHPHVARYTQAPPEQGGAGATIAELKQ